MTTQVMTEDALGIDPLVRRGVLERLAHFRIDRRIAGGGMGEVYLGFDTSLMRPVAIKTIRPELSRDQGFLSRFCREATAQANVVHPNVVQVYFIGQDQGVWFIAMQVVDGGSLHDLLDRGERPTWQEAARMMTALASGLVEAARKGIVHRDIKPANILLDGSGAPYLADFGLAKARGEVDVPSSTSSAPAGSSTSDPRGSQLQLADVTQVGSVSGTPGYVAPEQLTGAALDERADLYALGATFFHLLTGRPPVEARTLPEAMAAHKLGQRAPPVRSLAPEVPAAFAAVLDRCLEPDRDRRFATAADLLRALRAASPQPFVPAGPVARALVWAMDVVPFLLLYALTYDVGAWVAPLAFLVAGVVGLAFLGSTPGIWLLRLRLRSTGDGDVPLARGLARFLVQHGWFVPLSLFVSAAYASVPYAEALGLFGLAWLAASLLGALGALLPGRQALHDRLTRTHVLVDVRMG